VVELRVAEPSEAAAIAALHTRTTRFAYAEIFPPEAPPPTLEDLIDDWTTRLTDPSTRVLVAEVDGVLVGVVAAGSLEGEGHLSRLHVDPDLWGRGIGRALYDRCVAEFEGSGTSVVTLWVLERNVRARSWYERLGWTDTGRRNPVYEPAGICDAVYRLTLDSRSTASDFSPA